MLPVDKIQLQEPIQYPELTEVTLNQHIEVYRQNQKDRYINSNLLTQDESAGAAEDSE